MSQIHARALYLFVHLFNYRTILNAKWDKTSKLWSAIILLWRDSSNVRQDIIWYIDASWAPSQYKDGLSRYGISISKIRRPWYRLIFTMGISIPVRRHLVTYCHGPLIISANECHFFNHRQFDYSKPYIIGEPCSMCPNNCENGLCGKISPYETPREKPFQLSAF